MTHLDTDVAEHRDEMVVFGGAGRTARSWEAFEANRVSTTDPGTGVIRPADAGYERAARFAAVDDMRIPIPPTEQTGSGA